MSVNHASSSHPRKISWARSYGASYWFHSALVDYAGAFICEVLWNQEFVLEPVI